MNDIIRQKIKGRSLVEQFGRWTVRDNWVEHRRQKPVGYTHTSLARIPKSHTSSRLMQDFIEEMLRRKIRMTPPGQRRDFYIRDYEIWVANGRPTYGHFQNSKRRDKLAEPIKTWQKGKPLYVDFTELHNEMERKMKIRRILYGRTVA
ncbi:hypothetical protein KKF45_04730 [Patescibacteria group bacterium]|nr:hypothetical protein [Patescibacteria group bacterium]